MPAWPEGQRGPGKGWGRGDDTAASGRYQSLEKLLEAELQAAATSKEEALMELKKRALQLEEELYQVRLPPASWGPHPTLPPVPPAPPLVLSHLLALCPLSGPVGGSSVLKGRLTLPGPGGLLGALSPHSSNGQNLMALL